MNIPGLTPQKIVDGLEAHADMLRAKGAEVKVLLYDPNDFSSVERIVLPELARCDVFEIGAGVRNIPTYLLYFEQLVNFIHEHAPKTTKICFNTKPDDTCAAIERWL